MNLADRLAAARNQRRIEAGLPPLPGFETAAPASSVATEPLSSASATSAASPAATPAPAAPVQERDGVSPPVGDGLAEVIDLRSQQPAPMTVAEPPVIDLRTDPGDGFDLTDPNAVLTWRWEARYYDVEPPDTHGSAWASFDEYRRKPAGRDEGDELELPNNSTWAERYQAIRSQRLRPS